MTRVINDYVLDKSKLDYDKHGGKSKLLGIFEGKKAEYNKLILKGLVFGPKTTNQVSECIYLNRKAQVLPREVNRNEIRKIVSIISRKGSRLAELESKEYIFRRASKDHWTLTIKGMGVALTFYDSIAEISPYVKPFLHSTVEEFQKTIRNIPMLQPFRNIEKKAMNKAFDFFESEEFLQFLKDLTNGLIRQGTDTDKTTLKDFMNVLIGRFFVVYLPRILMQKSTKKRKVVGHE